MTTLISTFKQDFWKFARTVEQQSTLDEVFAQWSVKNKFSSTTSEIMYSSILSEIDKKASFEFDRKAVEVSLEELKALMDKNSENPLDAFPQTDFTGGTTLENPTDDQFSAALDSADFPDTGVTAPNAPAPTSPGETPAEGTDTSTAPASPAPAEKNKDLKLMSTLKA